MNEASLISAFELLDDFLSAGNSAPVWLVVGGGSALLVQRLSSRQTKDVDLMALREWEGNIVSAYPLPDAVTQAVAKVAEELGLDPDWLNGTASLHGIDLSLLPDWFWQELDTREYGHFIGRKGLILLKLSAALDRDQRRDIEDLTCLCASSAKMEELLRWVLRNLQSPETSHPSPRTRPCRPHSKIPLASSPREWSICFGASGPPSAWRDMRVRAKIGSSTPRRCCSPPPALVATIPA